MRFSWIIDRLVKIRYENFAGDPFLDLPVVEYSAQNHKSCLDQRCIRCRQKELWKKVNGERDV